MLFGNASRIIQVVIRKPYGFKTSDMPEISLYHKFDKLPVPGNREMSD